MDLDIFDEDRQDVFNRIIKKIGKEKTAHVFAIGTNQELGSIDDIGRALDIKWKEENGLSTKELKKIKKELQNSSLEKEEKKIQIEKINKEIKEIEEKNDKLNSPYSLKNIEKIKKEYKENPEICKERYKDLFYYLDGMVGVKISQSMHPAGIVASPITLKDHYGTMLNEDKIVLQLDMDNAHECGLIKYDVLGLKTIGVIKKAYQYMNKKYPKMNEINWNDIEVWKDISNNNIAIFQFESSFSGTLLKKMQPRSVFDLSLVNACVRPSGSSYRDKLTNHEVNYNPDERVSKLLSDSYGFLVYQEQQIKFLQEICGLTGSQADTVRRAIGKYLPPILEII